MSKTKSVMIGEQRPLWLFRDLVDPCHADELLAAASEVGRLERWGHAAKVPVFAGGDEVVLVVEGTIITEGSGVGEMVRLTSGDGFGKTPLGRLADSGDEPLVVESVRETTICSIAVDQLRQVWDAPRARRQVQAGGWFNRTTLEVPVWPLIGAMPTTRVARILLHLVEAYGDIQGRQGRLPLTLRPSKLASMAGLDKDRARKVWRIFQGADLVAVDRGGLILKDISQLREYALG